MPTDRCPKCSVLWSEHEGIEEMCRKLNEARRCFRFLQRQFSDRRGPGMDNKEVARYCRDVLKLIK